MDQVIYNLHAGRNVQNTTYLLAYPQAQGLTRGSLVFLQPTNKLEALADSIYKEVVKSFFILDLRQVTKALEQPKNKPYIGINNWAIPPVRRLEVQGVTLELQTPDKYSATMILLRSNNLIKKYLTERKQEFEQEAEFNKRFPNPVIGTLEV